MRWFLGDFWGFFGIFRFSVTLLRDFVDFWGVILGFEFSVFRVVADWLSLVLVCLGFCFRFWVWEFVG